MAQRFVISDGAENLANRLARLNVTELGKVVGTVTELARAALVDKITSDIRPHSGLHRKRNPQPTVTDLVDTGAYRASWQVSRPGPFMGKVATNSEYALALEYGTENRAGFYVARDVAKKMRVVFKRRVAEAMRLQLK